MTLCTRGFKNCTGTAKFVVPGITQDQYVCGACLENGEHEEAKRIREG